MRQYDHLKTQEASKEWGNTLTNLGSNSMLPMTQMSMKQGLRQFGQEGSAAVKAKMTQLHDRQVMKPVKSKELMAAQHWEALAYLMFLNHKRCG